MNKSHVVLTKRERDCAQAAFQRKRARFARISYDRMMNLFKEYKSDDSVCALNLACGANYGDELFPVYFPHANAKLIGIDKKLNDRRAPLRGTIQPQARFPVFECNLKSEIPDGVSKIMKTSQLWFVVYSCGAEFHIIRLFARYAQQGAKLILCPCGCAVPHRYDLVRNLGKRKWNTIVDKVQKKYRTGITNPPPYKRKHHTRFSNRLWFRRARESSGKTSNTKNMATSKSEWEAYLSVLTESAQKQNLACQRRSVETSFKPIQFLEIAK